MRVDATLTLLALATVANAQSAPLLVFRMLQERSERS